LNCGGDIIRVLIADDQRLIRESLKLMIDKTNDIEVIASVSNGKEAFEYCCKLKPDIVLMDILIPECNGIEAAKLIKAKLPQIKILILTSSTDEADTYEALKNGADGYILKDVGKEELILSIKSTAAGLAIIQRKLLNNVSINKKPGPGNDKNSVEINGANITLTERQLTIIRMIADGYDNRQIGAKLFIAEGTVKNIITDLISKLQLKDRTQLVVFAMKNKLI
jgi:DNA-binding NarL/FixJ family response regulator